MDDKFDNWLRKQPGVYPTIWEIELARKAWDARGELEKPNVTPNVTENIKKQFGCVYNCSIYYNCVLDHKTGGTCDRSHLVTKRENCSRWRPIE